jgi:hypothetical protein
MTAVIVKTPRRWTASEADRRYGPSIFTAFREQLKLKSESQKGPFEIFESNVLKGLQKLTRTRQLDGNGFEDNGGIAPSRTTNGTQADFRGVWPRSLLWNVRFPVVRTSAGSRTGYDTCLWLRFRIERRSFHFIVGIVSGCFNDCSVCGPD